MKISSLSIRIVLGLVSLTVSAVLVAGLLGLIPNVGTSAQRNREAFCEAVAVSFMALEPRMTEREILTTFDSIRERNPEVESIAARKLDDGRLVFASGPHAWIWETVGERPFTSREFVVPISTNKGDLRQLEIRFTEVAAGPFGATMRPRFSLAIFIGCGLFVAFSAYLRRVLQHLNPSQVIPPRVREALDALAEGLLVLDRDGVVMLANAAFAQHTSETAEDLLGRKASELGFRMVGESSENDYPWLKTAACGERRRGALMKFSTANSERTFSLSTVPIHDEMQCIRGVVASFEDVTELDRKQRELRDALQSLKQSSEEIRQQNHELEWLATRDALTGCVNRRSFFKMFKAVWDEAQQNSRELSAVMVDIDNFKAINDNHGHARGDEILQRVAAAIVKTISEDDVLCRYGGEEFSVFMPGTNIDEAELRAERIRLAIKTLVTDDLRVTASLGVSSMAHNSTSPQDLLDQADKSMFVAKRHGRNQVVRFDKARKQIAQLADSAAPELVERIISAIRVRISDRTEMPGVSTDIALDIGQQIEQLGAALDDQDIGELRELTQRLYTTADRAGIQYMADVADQLMESLDEEADIIRIMHSANELLDLCRLTQVSIIQGDTHRLVGI